VDKGRGRNLWPSIEILCYKLLKMSLKIERGYGGGTAIRIGFRKSTRGQNWSKRTSTEKRNETGNYTENPRFIKDH